MFTELPPARRRDHPRRPGRDRPRLLLDRRLRHRATRRSTAWQLRGHDRPQRAAARRRARPGCSRRATTTSGGRDAPHRSQPRREGRDRRRDRARAPARAADAARLARGRPRAAPRRGEPPRGLPPAAPDRRGPGRDVRRQLLLDRRGALRHVPGARSASSTSSSIPRQYGALTHRRPDRPPRVPGRLVREVGRGPRGRRRVRVVAARSGRRPTASACFFRQDWVRAGRQGRARGRAPAGAGAGRPCAATHVAPPARGAAAPRAVTVDAGPTGVVLRSAGPTALAGRVRPARPTTWRSSSTTASPRRSPARSSRVWLDDRQVYTTAADWSGATGHHAVVDVSTLDPGRHTLTAVRHSGRAATGDRDASSSAASWSSSQPGAAPPATPLSRRREARAPRARAVRDRRLLAWLLRRGERRADAREAPARTRQPAEPGHVGDHARRPARGGARRRLGMIPWSARSRAMPALLPVYDGGWREHPEDPLRRDLGRLPVRVVEVRHRGEEPLGRDRDVDAERVDRDAVRPQVLGRGRGEALERGLRHPVRHLARDRR